jgi:REP element-mobilizing transposase RayT
MTPSDRGPPLSAPSGSPDPAEASPLPPYRELWLSDLAASPAPVRGTALANEWVSHRSKESGHPRCPPGKGPMDNYRNATQNPNEGNGDMQGFQGKKLAILPERGDNAGMPRTARADLGGYCYHALNRGNGRAQVFHDADDYHGFVRLLRQACARLPMRLVAFCLLPNHFHLVLWPRADGQLGPWMQWLLTAHVNGYRKRYGGSGHVWQGRFRAFPIEQDDHLLTVLRYVERNPLRAGLVERAKEWPWSNLPL